VNRLLRHARLTWANYTRQPGPPLLVLFVNSTCNQKCEHCFYWRSLNRDDDLTKQEIFALSEELGRIENLNLSGGEPFLRPELAEICRRFVRRNRVRQIYVPTNAYFPDRLEAHIADTLREKDLDLFVAEISLDGMPEFHDRFRVSPGAFERAMASYEALARLQERDRRLRIHAISTATDVNLEEIRRLTTYLFDRCPRMDHHNLAMIRGDRKNPALGAPELAEYADLYQYIRRLWRSRERSRYGAAVEPMLQWAKIRTARELRQVVPCRAGVLTAVVYANGDVSLCETHPPLGNLRQKSFRQIWRSTEADRLRASIRGKQCWCTNETFLWPSFTYAPAQLVRVVAAARPWREPPPLQPGEKVALPESSEVDAARIPAAR